MAKKEELTPMMRQFYDLKAKHPDALLLFRCGDFYETYNEDAQIAADILGITLTKRSSVAGTSASGTAMAGFPHHALDTYLPKLIRAGKRVAICDQLEDPKLAKKLVKRGITELVTPGVALSDNVLSTKENNFLASVHFGKGACGVAFLDISTGEFLTTEGTCDYVDKLLANFAPKEVLFEQGRKPMFLGNFGSKFFTFEMDDWIFTDDSAKKKLLSHFGVKNLKGYGVEHLKDGIIAAGAILYYLEQTQHTHISHIRNIQRIEQNKYVRMDRFTIRSLELVDSMNEGGTSLLKVIDKTVSPMGGRMLRRWMLFPLKDVKPIEDRQNVVEYFFREPELRDAIEEQLHQIGDLERLASKVAVGRISPREMMQLKIALDAVAPIKKVLLEYENEGKSGIRNEELGIDTKEVPGSLHESDYGDERVNERYLRNNFESLRQLGEQLDPCEELRDIIGRTLSSNPPIAINKGNTIADGVNQELDELRQIAYSGKDYLLKIQEREIENTGIASLKIGFNNVFGYYMEVRNTYKDLVPQDWIRKQTLTQAERYITQELKEYEEKILGAEDKIASLELQIYNNLILKSTEFIAQLQKDAGLIAQLDVLLSFAYAAKEYHYNRPIVDNSTVIDIKQGRHPVIERQMPVGEQYVANDLYLDTETQQVMILTGPNMAGKSALLRQTALIAILAQIGSFVPVDSARIGICDKIFTRVGASDNISVGESTFMVEMNEAASILNNLSTRSLVLFDELGRGTSTYDGISIAWSIVEYIHNNPQAHARTLFATHYHELNEMEKQLQRVKNFNVSVKEQNGQVIFLRKLMPGGSEHSFGIHVAKIAGMAPTIVKRAEQVLKELEANNSGDSISRPCTEKIGSSDSNNQLSFFQLDDPVLCQVRDEILGLDINSLTPLEALNKLNEIKRIVKGK